MKAQDGKTYALIQDGRVHQTFTKAELPEWHDGLDIVDITVISPAPVAGDLYDGVVFSSAPLIADAPVLSLAEQILSNPIELNKLKIALGL